MNLVDYMDCLSEDFVFYPDERDVQDPELDIPSEWYRSTEQIIHTNMFDPAGPVSDVQLTLTTADVFWDVQDPENPLDDIYSHTEYVDLRVSMPGPMIYLATASSMYFLRVDRGEVGPYGESMWEIFQWYDLDEGGCARPVLPTSWGELKALFLDIDYARAVRRPTGPSGPG